MEDLEEMRMESRNEPDLDFRLWSSSKTDTDTRAVRTVYSDILAQAFTHDIEAVEVLQIEIPKAMKKSNQQMTNHFGAKVTGEIRFIPKI